MFILLTRVQPGVLTPRACAWHTRVQRAHSYSCGSALILKHSKGYQRALASVRRMMESLAGQAARLLNWQIKHRGSTFLPVPHAPQGYGAPLGRRWATAADGEGTSCSEASDERCAARFAGVEGGGILRAGQRDCSRVSPAGNCEVFPVLIPYVDHVENCTLH